MDEKKNEMSATELLAQPITLPCGLTLPNRLVKCPMQETLAIAPTFDPPIEHFANLYGKWSRAKYGLLITGQVQVDLRFFSIAGDVCVHQGSMEPAILNRWKEWASIAQSNGTPCIVQLAHPGRMSPAGAGVRPADMPAPCPSSVPVKMGDGWLDKLAMQQVLGTPKAMTVAEIDEAVANFVQGARVAQAAGFSGVQIHGAHGFLVSQFLSPHTNRRTDDYGGSAPARLLFLQRIVREVRAICPKPFCVSVKLNSADYMTAGAGLEQDEALDQVRWLVGCGLVDFVEISGGNAEQKTSRLHNSFGERSLAVAPKMRASTRAREAAFADFADRIRDDGMISESGVPIQLSGGFRSRVGMADAIDAGQCDLIGLGRAAVLEPELPAKVLLNPDVPDDQALAMSHQIRGQWLSNWFPVKVVGGSLPIKFFYYNMRRLGHGLSSDPNASIPWIVIASIWETLKASCLRTVQGTALARVSG